MQEMESVKPWKIIKTSDFYQEGSSLSYQLQRKFEFWCYGPIIYFDKADQPINSWVESFGGKLSYLNLTVEILFFPFYRQKSKGKFRKKTKESRKKEKAPRLHCNFKWALLHLPQIVTVLHIVTKVSAMQWHFALYQITPCYIKKQVDSHFDYISFEKK